MTNKTKLQIISVAAAGAVFAILGIDNRLETEQYIVRSKKINKPVSIVFLSDVHSQKFKDGGENLLNLIDSAKPDFILFGGDIFDKHSDMKELEKTLSLVCKITNIYDECYFVLGNHEVDSRIGVNFSEFLENSGLRLIGGESVELTAKNGQKILLGGADFVRFGDGYEDKAAQLNKKELIRKAKENGEFSVLLRHVPMKTAGDEKVDLILSGHNHGGLWRFPNTNAGVAGGCKKIFPRYVHGTYKNGESTMIVGSGITTETYLLPRLYNSPEVVNVRLLPETNMPAKK